MYSCILLLSFGTGTCGFWNYSLSEHRIRARTAHFEQQEAKHARHLDELTIAHSRLLQELDHLNQTNTQRKDAMTGLKAKLGDALAAAGKVAGKDGGKDGVEEGSIRGWRNKYGERTGKVRGRLKMSPCTVFLQPLWCSDVMLQKILSNFFPQIPPRGPTSPPTSKQLCSFPTSCTPSCKP